ncbi:MAG: hypothetical protein KGR98_01680 [Verrucomicrobia bacterium]|nr:hypothetical protein [Verrucomicrobiota bacterium]MDE3099639.1 hypothetical protein [Verrucomicrobiota bacterium]
MTINRNDPVKTGGTDDFAVRGGALPPGMMARASRRSTQNSMARFRFGTVPAAIWIFALSLAIQTGAQQAPGGETTDFTSTQYYPHPNETRVRSELSGARAQLMADGRLLLIQQLRLETFATNGRSQMIVRAPQCVYDPLTGQGNSSGPLQLEASGGRVRISGEGFLWRQSDSSLIISNRVQTTIISRPALDHGHDE